MSKDQDTPRIGPRRNKKAPIPITGRFKSIDEEFTITATPEAWSKLYKSCWDGSWDAFHYQRKGLFEDLRPFIGASHGAMLPWKPKEGRQIFRNALYIQTAIINDLLRKKYSKKHDYEIWEKTFRKFKSVWRDETAYLRLAMIDEKPDHLNKKKSILEKRFYSHYILKGRRLLNRKDKAYIKRLFDVLLTFLLDKRKRNLNGFTKNEKTFQQVLDMTQAVEALVSGQNEWDSRNHKDIQRYTCLASEAFPFLSK